MRSSRLVFAYVFVVAVVFTLHNLYAGQRVEPTLPIQAGNAQGTAKEEQPTFIQEGQITEKQKQHSKFFKNYGDVTRGKKIRDLSLSDDVNLLREKGSEILTSSSYLTAHEYLSLLACHADAVVVGVVENKASQLTEDGTFLFTDYGFTPEEVLKSNLSDPLQVNLEITVTRTGGLAILNGHTVRAIDETQKPLRVGGRYLLFLRYIPATRAYRSLGSTSGDDSFEMVNSSVNQVSDQHAPLGSKKVDQESFLGIVREVINLS
jgi:hypothetical protein